MSTQWRFIFLFTFILVKSADAQNEPRWSMGGFLGYTKPLAGLNEHFTGALSYGAMLTYRSNTWLNGELEYRHAKFDEGVLESGQFLWSPGPSKVKQYTSKALNPNSNHTNTANSLMVNAILFLRSQAEIRRWQLHPYLIGGIGHHSYKTLAENIIWPGQSPTDARNAGGGVDADGDILPSIVMNPQRDEGSGNIWAVGLGCHLIVAQNLAVDVRGRYFSAVGALPPYDTWGASFSRGMSSFFFGFGLKYFF
jgi:opacity protein-like surface antigen